MPGKIGPFSVLEVKPSRPTARPGIILPQKGALLLDRPYQGPRGIYVPEAYFQVATLGTALATHGLLNCAALVLLDRELGRHYLSHVDMTISVTRIRASFRGFDLAHSEKYILPGPLCTETAQNILAAFRSDGRDNKLKVITCRGTGLRGITSYRGELFLAPPRGYMLRSARSGF
jgi:hypothetical protein